MIAVLLFCGRKASGLEASHRCKTISYVGGLILSTNQPEVALMIFSTFLLKRGTHRSFASSEHWPVNVESTHLKAYLAKLDELREQSDRARYAPVTIDSFKFFSRNCSEDSLVVFVTSFSADDTEVTQQINRAARVLRTALEKLSQKELKASYGELVAPAVRRRFVISLVGQSGVGKTSLLHLLMGTEPPDEYTPTIALNMEVIEDLVVGSCEIAVLDFAGQEKSRKMWDLRSSHIVLLLTDSTLGNIIASKKILSTLRAEYPSLPVYVIANKQDQPNALDPSAISKVMDADAHAMVAIDLAYRGDIFSLLVRILCDYFRIQVPEMATEELLGLGFASKGAA